MSRLNNVLQHWHHRKVITERDFIVGQRIRRVWDDAEMIGLAAIRLDRLHPEREWGGAQQMMRVVEARQALLRLRPILGEIDDHLVTGVLGQGQSLEAMAKRWALIGGKEDCAWRIRMALRMLGLKRWATAEEIIQAHPFAA